MYFLMIATCGEYISSPAFLRWCCFSGGDKRDDFMSIEDLLLWSFTASFVPIARLPTRQSS